MQIEKRVLAAPEKCSIIQNMYWVLETYKTHPTPKRSSKYQPGLNGWETVLIYTFDSTETSQRRPWLISSINPNIDLKCFEESNFFIRYIGDSARKRTHLHCARKGHSIFLSFFDFVESTLLSKSIICRYIKSPIELRDFVCWDDIEQMNEKN